jgi:meiotic recombination protein REC8
MLTVRQEIEIGRAAMPELEDRSSTMPWNASASVRRSRPGSSARKLRHFHETSMGGFATSGGASAIGLELGVPGSASRRVSRLTSASPLEGRERGGVIERLSSLEVADEDNTAAIQQSDHLNLDAQDQFEIFGPAATVDTQTAVQTQWMNQAFERESFNFLDYVHHSAAQRNQTSAQDGSDQTDPQVLSEVAFGGLLRPESNTKIVASQAFLHVLSLATKGLLTARQERNDGEIYICPIIST